MKTIHGLQAAMVVVSVCVGPAGACAEDFVSGTEGQEELNEQGVKAIVDGNYPAAIRLFKSSLDLGELNITYLNLGRAYQKAMRCEDALKAYNDVEAAPRVEQPSPSQISAALEKYRAELARTCNGFVLLKCSPPTMKVATDGGEPVACTDERIELKPGQHGFEGIKGERRARAGVTVVGMETSTVTLDLGPEPVSLMETFAWVTTGTGTALILTAVAVDLLVLGPKIDDLDAASTGSDEAEFNRLKDDLESSQALNVGLYIGGGALIATGVALFLMAPDATDDEAPVSRLSPSNLRVWAGRDAAGLVFTAPW